jgi:hypothetical protein
MGRYIFCEQRSFMNCFKVFIPSMVGVIIIISSYFMESMLNSNIEADKHLTSNIAMLLEKQNIEDGAAELINSSVNSLMENNHLLLLQYTDVIWSIGLGFLLWFFPYDVVFRVREKKI